MRCALQRMLEISKLTDTRTISINFLFPRNIYSIEVRFTTVHNSSLNRSLFLQESARILEQTATATSVCTANCAARKLLYVYAC